MSDVRELADFINGSRGRAFIRASSSALPIKIERAPIWLHFRGLFDGWLAGSGFGATKVGRREAGDAKHRPARRRTNANRSAAIDKIILEGSARHCGAQS